MGDLASRCEGKLCWAQQALLLPWPRAWCYLAPLHNLQPFCLPDMSRKLHTGLLLISTKAIWLESVVLCRYLGRPQLRFEYPLDSVSTEEDVQSVAEDSNLLLHPEDLGAKAEPDTGPAVVKVEILR